MQKCFLSDPHRSYSMLKESIFGFIFRSLHLALLTALIHSFSLYLSSLSLQNPNRSLSEWLVNQPRGIAVDILSYNTRIRWLRWELSTRAVRRIIKRRLSSPRAIQYKVMGEDRRVRVRTFGLGVTPSDSHDPQAAAAEERATIAEARAAIAEARAAAAEARAVTVEARGLAVEARGLAAEARAVAAEARRISEIESAQRTALEQRVVALEEEMVQLRTQLNQVMTCVQRFTGSGPSSSSSEPVFGATPDDIQRDG
ncbi:hypothetical protein AAC387_Pa03g0803 [Persea americana]